MRKVVAVTAISVVVLGGFGACGWALYEAHEDQAMLRGKVESLESQLADDKAARQASGRTLLAIWKRIDDMESKVGRLETAAFGPPWKLSPIDDPRMSGPSLAEQIDEVQWRLDELCLTVRVVQTSVFC